MSDLHRTSLSRSTLGAALVGFGVLGVLGHISPTMASAETDLSQASLHDQPALLAQTAEVDTDLEELLNLVNVERQKIGADPLVLSEPLMAAAQSHAQDMADTQNLSHTGSDGSTMRSRIEATGYDWAAIGENVAMGQPTATAVMEAWMNSSGHRRNILNPNFTELGLGYAEGGGSPYWVQVFAKPQ